MYPKRATQQIYTHVMKATVKKKKKMDRSMILFFWYVCKKKHWLACYIWCLVFKVWSVKMGQESLQQQKQTIRKEDLFSHFCNCSHLYVSRPSSLFQLFPQHQNKVRMPTNIIINIRNWFLPQKCYQKYMSDFCNFSCSMCLEEE